MYISIKIIDKKKKRLKLPVEQKSIPKLPLLYLGFMHNWRWDSRTENILSI